MPSVIIVITICMGIFVFNIGVAAGIHAIRESPASKETCFTSIVLMLCAPYMIYLVVTKQGHVIDAIAKEENDKITEYFKAYKEEKKDG